MQPDHNLLHCLLSTLFKTYFYSSILFNWSDSTLYVNVKYIFFKRRISRVLFVWGLVWFWDPRAWDVQPERRPTILPFLRLVKSHTHARARTLLKGWQWHTKLTMAIPFYFSTVILIFIMLKKTFKHTFLTQLVVLNHCLVEMTTGCFFVSDNSTACKRGWHALNGTCYSVLTTLNEQSVQEWRSSCGQSGGRLLTLNNQDQHQFISKLIMGE